jgi:hypothetical protein
VPLYPADIVGSNDDSRYFITDKIGHELLLTVIAVKINFMIKRRIIMKDFRRNLIFRSTAQNDFIYPHILTIILMAIHVQMRLIKHGL